MIRQDDVDASVLKSSKVSFVLDKNCWVCAKWMLHYTVTSPFRSRNRNGDKASPAIVECSNHFVHTQQFLSYAKLTLMSSVARNFNSMAHWGVSLEI